MIEKPKGKPKNDAPAANNLSTFLSCIIIIFVIGLTCSTIAVSPAIGTILWASVFPQPLDSCEHYIADTNGYRIQRMNRGLRGMSNQRYQATVDSGKTWTTFHYWNPGSDYHFGECDDVFFVSSESYYFIFPFDYSYFSTIVITNDGGQTWHTWDAWSQRDGWPEDYFCAELYDIQFEDALHGSFRQECRTMGPTYNYINYYYVTNNGGETWEIADD